MLLKKQKLLFELKKNIYEKALITFVGVDGFDVYNCSIPFMYNGKKHIYGRVEKREEWANSHVRLFVETAKDEFTVLPELSWELEDPYITSIDGEMIFGGTHIRKSNCFVTSYCGFFYRGSPFNLRYFTAGPNNMKDIRTVQLADKRIGVFSRARTTNYACIGFGVINCIEELSMQSILSTHPLDLFEEGAWGGVNQPYLLSSGKIGCIAHYSYLDRNESGEDLAVYVNYSFVLNPSNLNVECAKIIGTKSCYPPCEAKKPRLIDCVFTSGIVMRDDGKCDLYSGVGDTYEGRITIDYPFQGHGEIIDNLDFDKNKPLHRSSL